MKVEDRECVLKSVENLGKEVKCKGEQWKGLKSPE
jgi:hypothetical protein